MTKSFFGNTNITVTVYICCIYIHTRLMCPVITYIALDTFIIKWFSTNDAFYFLIIRTWFRCRIFLIRWAVIIFVDFDIFLEFLVFSFNSFLKGDDVKVLLFWVLLLLTDSRFFEASGRGDKILSTSLTSSVLNEDLGVSLSEVYLRLKLKH